MGLFDKKFCFGMEVDELAKMRIFEDGNGDIAVFKEEMSAMKWSKGEGENQYILSPEYAESDEENLNATFKDGKVILSILGHDTMTDGEGNTTTTESETLITFDPAKKKESRNEKLAIELTDEETRAMSNFMNESMYLNVDGVLYGTFEPLDFVMADLEMDKDKIGMKEPKVIKKNCLAKYLTQKDDYVYAVLQNEGEDDPSEIVKVKKGTDKAEKVYDGMAKYLQIVGDNLYFTDENNNFVKTDLNGKKNPSLLKRTAITPIS